MPLLPFGVAGILTPALLGTGMLGLGTPKFALGVSIGVSKWIKTVPVTTIDAGSFGVGSGQLPLIVPQPLLLANIASSMASMDIKGVMMPLKALGLATGLAGGFALGLIKTTHPIIGLGTGMAKFGPSPAAPFIIAGLAEVGSVGPSVVKIATAIGMGLNKTFAMLTLPIPIVGSASPAGGAGVGSGTVI
jgi:hypothetical protein